MEIAASSAMAPNSLEYHFIISLIAALLGGGSWLFFNRRASLFLGAVAAFLGALTAGQVKELVDLVRNPWSLPFSALRSDAALDMVWNLSGATAGTTLLVISFGIARIVQNRGQRPFIPAGGPQ
jgi:hypothetical protein